VFAQSIGHLPHKKFQKCVTATWEAGTRRNLSCWDQYLAMAFTQLTNRESPRDIETCLCAAGGRLYQMGFRSSVTRRRWPMPTSRVTGAFTPISRRR
jgi:hypothetical protein